MDGLTNFDAAQTVIYHRLIGVVPAKLQKVSKLQLCRPHHAHWELKGNQKKGYVMKTSNCFILAALITMAAMVLGGCAGHNLSSYQSASSTKVGCPPNEVIITDLDRHGLMRTRDWVATCNGISYYCSGVNDGYGGTTNVSCMKKSAKAKSVTQPVESKSEPTVMNQTARSSVSMVARQNNTRVRKSPSSKATVIKSLKKGEEVQVVKQKGEWFLVELTGGETGWCHNSVLRKNN